MTFLQNINNYWGPITSIAALVFGCLWLYFKVMELVGRVERLEQDNQSNVSSIQEIKGRLASIEAKLDILVDGYNKK